MNEVWQYVEQFPDYAISNLGRVVNLKFDRLLKPIVTDRGYLRIMLRRNCQSYQFYVHQLVAEAFFGDWRPGVRVRHLDDDLSNNAVANLEIMGGECRTPAVYCSPRLTARKLRIIETGEVFRTAYDCAAYIGGNATNIYRVLNGYRDSHRGYTFEYVDAQVKERQI